MSRWKFTAMVAVVMAVLGTASSVLAQGNQPQFTIAPPPLAYPDYSAPGTSQGKGTATYIGVSVEGFDLTGIGGAFTFRSVGEKLPDDLGQGLSMGGGLYLLSGSGSGFDLSGFQLSFMGNYERELAPKLIGFGGLNFSEQYIQLTGGFGEVDVFTFLYGFQAGAQYSVEAGSLTYSPWLMYQRSTGSASVDVYPAGGGYYGASADVTVTATVIGFDILHVPSGVTLSGMLQQATGDNGDSDVTILQVSWTFGGEEPAESKTASLPRAPAPAGSVGGSTLPRS